MLRFLTILGLGIFAISNGFAMNMAITSNKGTKALKGIEEQINILEQLIDDITNEMDFLNDLETCHQQNSFYSPQKAKGVAGGNCYKPTKIADGPGEVIGLEDPQNYGPGEKINLASLAGQSLSSLSEEYYISYDVGTKNDNETIFLHTPKPQDFRRIFTEFKDDQGDIKATIYSEKKWDSDILDPRLNTTQSLDCPPGGDCQIMIRNTSIRKRQMTLQ